MQRDMLEKIEQIPGVRSAVFTTSLPMDNLNSADPLFARDRVYADGKIPPIRRFVFISPGLRKTLGTPLIAGRDLTWGEVENKTPQSHSLPKASRASIGKRRQTLCTNRFATVRADLGGKSSALPAMYTKKV
jgi:hypothetical protein